MSHKVTIGTLVLDFKRTNEGKGIVAGRALSALVALTLAYNAPLPNNGKTGAIQAMSQVLNPYMRNLISDVNEIMHLDVGAIEEVAQALYVNRYDQVWCPRGALESCSLKQIMAALGDDITETVALWTDRFMSAVEAYQEEVKEKQA